MDWCTRLIRGESGPDDPDLGWLGGTDEWAPYWRRVWGCRGLLYVWGEVPESVSAVRKALGDEHWRVREMACKVVRAQDLGDLATAVGILLQDDNARVRAAADRALKAID